MAPSQVWEKNPAPSMTSKRPIWNMVMHVTSGKTSQMFMFLIPCSASARSCGFRLKNSEVYSSDGLVDSASSAWSCV